MRDIDLSAIRAQLAGKQGPTFWRSLEEVAATPEFEEMLHREFPVGASELDDPAGRRDFLRLMGASLALAGAAACTRQPAETIIPYVSAPGRDHPGQAAVLRHRDAARRAPRCPVLVESQWAGRPRSSPTPITRDTRGGTDVFAQASVLTLYDPDRSPTMTWRGEITTWSAFLNAMTGVMAKQHGDAGRRLPSADRDGLVADARVANPAAAGGAAAGEMDSVRSGVAATSRAPARARHSARSSSRSIGSIRRTSSCRSKRTSSTAARASCATRAISPSAAASPRAGRR